MPRALSHHDAAGPRARAARPAQTSRSRRSPPAANDKALAVLKQFRELFRVSQQHFQRIEGSCGVSGAQLWALAELCDRPGQTVSELAVALSVHLSTASNLTVRLEKRGLVRRHKSANDQRAVCLYATARGTRCLARAPQPVAGIIPDALQRMSNRSLSALNRDLEALLQLTRARDPEAAFELMSE